jgi:hypothetical protein
MKRRERRRFVIVDLEDPFEVADLKDVLERGSQTDDLELDPDRVGFSLKMDELAEHRTRNILDVFEAEQDLPERMLAHEAAKLFADLLDGRVGVDDVGIDEINNGHAVDVFHDEVIESRLGHSAFSLGESEPDGRNDRTLIPSNLLGPTVEFHAEPDLAR